ncbi:MAG: hypothetical protein KAX64_00595 [Chromatiaceae bacterium]|nr:hypothetical protein [Chromatiaceae bacterium]
MTPTRYDNQGFWNARVERGATREERLASLATVPDKYRQRVMDHVSCLFKIKAEPSRGG